MKQYFCVNAFDHFLPLFFLLFDCDGNHLYCFHFKTLDIFSEQ